MKVLVTGNAGFIGYHVAKRLIERGDEVVGFDVVNDYYDPALKEARLALLEEAAGRQGGRYSFVRANLADRAAVETCFADHTFDRVIHLAAQAGIRYSLENPHSYVESNLIGFTNILEACRYARVAHLTYASTSSVYGANTKMPFSEHDMADHPLQFYAATKRANELMAHNYSALFRLPVTGSSARPLLPGKKARTSNCVSPAPCAPTTPTLPRGPTTPMSSPARMDSSVLLPEPDAPTIAAEPWGCKVKSIS